MTLAERDPGAAAAPAEAILEGLNPEQLEAVTHGEGPLLIVAGAGTGKTQVITRRIAWLMATRRARPEEILALTFTEKAAAEMEARVDTLVPMGMVGAQISTFHAFCDRLVRDHAIELGLTSQLRVESRAEILVFLREHLFELGLERYRPLGNPEQHLQALTTLFDRARDEDVSPADYLAFAERLAAEAGDDDAARDRAAMELEKARAYARYDALLLEHGRLDFGHQISLALRLLRERPYLARELKGRWRYVLVDEFQDTNHVQFELVKRLCGPRANLTIVGDDDQSIYRFRGAKVENLRAFVDTYPGAKQVLLNRNYRSGQRILDAAYRVVRHNDPERLEVALGLDKRLIAARAAGGDGEVECAVHATASDEADAVAREIAEAVAEGRRAPGDFAILARGHAHLDPFAAALHARGVRFHRVGTRGLYARPEVQLGLNVLRLLADPDDGAPLHFVLADPLFGADPVDLARLGATVRRRNRPLLRVIEQALADPAFALAAETRDAIERLLVLHRRLASTATRRPTAEVLYEFAVESGLLDRLTREDSPENLERVSNLNRLFSIVTRVSPLLRTDRVDSFIGHLDLLIEAGDDPAAAEIELDPDAVQLLTAHNAKGLEFPVVFVVQLVEQRFPGTNRGEALPLPDELRRGHGTAAEDAMREERRLFYVACTRAMDRLVLTAATDYGGRRARKPSRFVGEALGMPEPAKGAPPASALESIRRHAPAVEAPAPGLAPLRDDEGLSLSHSQIADFLACPLQYKYRHVMQVPMLATPGQMYGRAVHHALTVYYQHRIKGLPIEVEDVLAALDGAWVDHGFLSPQHEQLSREAARADVRHYVERAGRDPARPLGVELAFSFRRGRNEVVGRFDRVDETAEGVVIVDYKTAAVDDPGKAGDRARADAKEGQLGLYALAYRETRGVLPARGELHFVGGRVIGSVDFEPEHAEAALERIDQAAAGIRARAFAPKPSARTCAWCDYSRYCLHSAAKGA